MTKKKRAESDTLGIKKIDIGNMWGAQTQRSIANFNIGDAASMPIEIIRAYAILKKSAAYANHELSSFSKEKKVFQSGPVPTGAKGGC